MTYLSYLLFACISWSCLPFKVSAVWKLDASCNAWASDVRTAMQGAFSNSRAVVAMQKNPYFLKAGGHIVSPALIPDAVLRHANILQYYSLESTSDNGVLSSEDVIVYCDLTRFEPRTKKDKSGQTVITHFDYALKVEWPDGPMWARCSGPGYPSLVTAVTANYAQKFDNKPNVIQICPWYLNWLTAQKFKDSTQAKPAWLVDSLKGIQQVLQRFQKTPMDVRTGLLLDTVLSHELTHTSKAGASTDFLAPRPPALGWAYSVRFASVGNQNAENLAQLGATAALIQNENVMPNLAGDIVPLSLDAR